MDKRFRIGRDGPPFPIRDLRNYILELHRFEPRLFVSLIRAYRLFESLSQESEHLGDRVERGLRVTNGSSADIHFFAGNRMSNNAMPCGSDLWSACSVAGVRVFQYLYRILKVIAFQAGGDLIDHRRRPPHSIILRAD